MNKTLKWNMIVLLVFLLMKSLIGYSDGWGAHVSVNVLIGFVGIVGFSTGIAEIVHSKEGSASIPFVLVLSLVFLCLTFGFGDCSYIMVEGEEHAQRGVAVHLPWHHVRKFAHNPIGGELELEAFVLRQENGLPTTRHVLVTTKCTLTYQRPMEIVRFPSENNLHVELARVAFHAQKSLPFSEDYSEYAGAKFRELLKKDEEDFLVVEGYHFRLTEVEATAKLIESEEELGDFRRSNYCQELTTYDGGTKENPLKSFLREALLRFSE